MSKFDTVASRSGGLAGRSARGRGGPNRGRRGAAVVLAAAAALAAMPGVAARAANAEVDVVNGQSDLTSAATFANGGSLPDASSDVTFTNQAYGPSAFTLSGNAALTVGTLNDLSATPLTISNGTAATASTLTLSTPANGVSGTAGDLLYVASGSSLTIQNGLGTLGVALGASGNFNVAGTGTAAVTSAISGGFGITKTGSGTLTLGGTNTFTGPLAVTGGTVSFAADANLGGTAAPSTITLDGGTLSSTAITGSYNLGANRVIAVGPGGGTLVLAGSSTNGKINLGTANQLTGSGTFTKIGAADLQLGAAQNFSGTFNVSGLVEASVSGSLGTSTVNLNTNGELAVSTSAPALPNAITVTGSGTGSAAVLSSIGGSNGNLTGPLTVNAPLTVALRAFNTPTNVWNLTVSGNLSGTGPITTAPGTATVASNTLFLNGSNSGSYTGAITAAAGTNVAFGSAASLTGGTVTVNSSATAIGGIGVAFDAVPAFANARTGTTVGGVFAINTASFGQALDESTLGGVSGMFVGSNTTGTYNASTLAPAADGNYRVGGGGGTLTIPAVVFAGTGGLVVGDGRLNGGGTVVVGSTTNTYTGATTVNQGTVSVASINSVAGGAASSGLGAPTTVAAGTIALGSGVGTGGVRYTGAGETTDRVINLAGSTGGGVLDQSGTGALKFASNLTATVAGTKTLTLQGATAGTGEFAGVIANGSGTVAVAKAGSGTWTLSNANTYTGGTTIGGGILRVAGAPALGGATGNLTFSAAATLQFFGAGNTTLAAGKGVVLSAATINDTFDTGPITGGGGTTIAGVISGAGNLVKRDTVTQSLVANPLILTGTNTFTGGVTISSGALVITKSAGLGAGTKVVSIVPTANPGSYPSLQLDGSAGSIVLPATTSFTTSYDALNNNVPIAGAAGAVVNLAGNNTIAGAFSLTSGGGGTTFTSAAGTLTLAGNIAATTTSRSVFLRGDGTGVVSGVISNGSTAALPVNRDLGGGTWSLTAANTYTGGTNVTAGTLLANTTGTNAALGTGAVSIYNSGTLGGTGLTGTGTATAYLGATVAPGTPAATGTLRLAGPLTLSAVAAPGTTVGTGTTAPVVQVKLADATTSDVLALTGTGAAGVLTLSNPDVLNLVAQSAIAGQATYTIATFASEVGTFDTVLANGAATQSTDVGAANYVSVAYNPTNIQVTVANLAAVPEPTTAGAVAGLAAAAGLLRRRRRAR